MTVDLTFEDSIYGEIKLDAKLRPFINHAIVQRLQGIKQNGLKYLVFPGATHTRFEHSLGTAYLAAQLLKTLRKNQPSLSVDPKDEFCVILAALLHDVGHGPFSHMWETVVNDFQPLNGFKKPEKFVHEEMSAKLVDKLFLELADSEELTDLSKDDALFVKELIVGHPGEAVSTRWSDPECCFFYEIVSNKLNECDVDKVDYLVRDWHHADLGPGLQLSHKELFEGCRVYPDSSGRTHLCYSHQSIPHFLSVFTTRQQLYEEFIWNPQVQLNTAMYTSLFQLIGTECRITSGRSTAACDKDFCFLNAHSSLDSFILLNDETVLQAVEKLKDFAEKPMLHEFDAILSIGRSFLIGDFFLRPKTEDALRQFLAGLEGISDDAHVECFENHYKFGIGCLNPLEKLLTYKIDPMSNSPRAMTIGQTASEVLEKLLPRKLLERTKVTLFAKNYGSKEISENTTKALRKYFEANVDSISE